MPDPYTPVPTKTGFAPQHYLHLRHLKADELDGFRELCDRHMRSDGFHPSPWPEAPDPPAVMGICVQDTLGVIQGGVLIHDPYGHEAMIDRLFVSAAFRNTDIWQMLVDAAVAHFVVQNHAGIQLYAQVDKRDGRTNHLLDVMGFSAQAALGGAQRWELGSRGLVAIVDRALRLAARESRRNGHGVRFDIAVDTRFLRCGKLRGELYSIRETLSPIARRH